MNNSGLTNPIINEGIVYAGTIYDDRGEGCGITAIDAATGKIIWNFHTKNSIRNDIAFSNA